MLKGIAGFRVLGWAIGLEDSDPEAYWVVFLGPEVGVDGKADRNGGV